MQPINKYYRQFKEYAIVQYVGIAADEPKRLARLQNKGNLSKVSLLDRYGYTEEMARRKCEDYGLLSPMYKAGNRGGCWFCPNCKINAFAELKNRHPELWAELLELSKTPNLCSYGFKYGMSVQEVDAKIESINAQQRLF